MCVLRKNSIECNIPGGHRHGYHFCPHVVFSFIHGCQAMAAAVKYKCQWTFPISSWQSWSPGMWGKGTGSHPVSTITFGGGRQKWPPAALISRNIFLQQFGWGEKLWARNKLCQMLEMFMNQKLHVFGGLAHPLSTHSHMCTAHAVLGENTSDHQPHTTNLFIYDW